jgi:hypothetical protein
VRNAAGCRVLTRAKQYLYVSSANWYGGEPDGQGHRAVLVSPEVGEAGRRRELAPDDRRRRPGEPDEPIGDTGSGSSSRGPDARPDDRDEPFPMAGAGGGRGTEE